MQKRLKPSSTNQGLNWPGSRARLVRCMTWKEVAISALPPKPKMTPEVCNGRSLPKLDQAASNRRSGQASCKATHTPIPMPITAQTSEMMMPALVGSS